MREKGAVPIAKASFILLATQEKVVLCSRLNFLKIGTFSLASAFSSIQVGWRSTWWRKIASRFGLSGKVVVDFYECLLERNILEKSNELLLEESA